MTSCRWTLCVVKVMLLLGLLLPVTAVEEANQTTEEIVTSTAVLDIRTGYPTTVLALNEVLNETEENTTTVFASSTTFLNDGETSTVESLTTSLSPAITKRTVTKSHTHGTTKDESRSKEHDKIFSYDYYTLRQWGLICALILCIVGFLVLFSGKCRGVSCRRRQKRRYNITGL